MKLKTSLYEIYKTLQYDRILHDRMRNHLLENETLFKQQDPIIPLVCKH